MSSLDQENLRRAEYEIRNSVGNSNEGSSATWFLGVVVIAAIVGGIYVFGSDATVTPVGSGEPTPIVTDEVAPVTAPTE